MTEFFNPKPADVRAPGGPYSHGAIVKAGTELVYTAGQVGERPDGSVPATIEEQCDVAYTNLLGVLKAQGLGATDIVQLHVYVTDRAYREPSSAARVKYLGDHKPTSTFLIVQGLAHHSLMIEIEAVAAKK
jgi:enamine deaminase RidA (YjgF/YER057c/UK114 family)